MPFAAGAGGPADGNSLVYPWYFHNATAQDRGASDFDVRHRFVTSYVWRSGRTGRIAAPAGARRLGGWQLNGLLQLQTGTPLTMLAGKDQSQTLLNRDRAVYEAATPMATGACGNTAPCVDYINPARLRTAGARAVRQYGQSAICASPARRPGTWAFSRTFRLHESWKLQFRAEFFNIFNRVNYQAAEPELIRSIR